ETIGVQAVVKGDREAGETTLIERLTAQGRAASVRLSPRTQPPYRMGEHGPHPWGAGETGTAGPRPCPSGSVSSRPSDRVAPRMHQWLRCVRLSPSTSCL